MVANHAHTNGYNCNIQNKQRRCAGGIYFPKIGPSPLSQFRGKPAFLFDKAVASGTRDDAEGKGKDEEPTIAVEDQGEEKTGRDKEWEALQQGLNADSSPWKLASDSEVQQIIGDEWILMRDPKLPRQHKEAYFWQHQRSSKREKLLPCHTNGLTVMSNTIKWIVII